MTRRSVAPALVVAAVSALVPLGASVSAHRAPAGCAANNLGLNVSKDKTFVRNGDSVVYRVTVSNLDTPLQIACDFTGVTITLTLPASDGTPTGRVVTLAAGVDYPAGTPVTVVGTVPYTVDTAPAVSSVVTEARAVGTLHDAPNDDMAQIVKTLSTTITQPHTTLEVVASPSSGRIPLTVTYTYTEKNDSSTPTPIADVLLSDDTCAPIGFVAGDRDGNRLLDRGESWTFTCTRTFTEPGTFTNKVTAKGTDTIDGLGAPDEVAQTAVTTRAPHTTLTVTADNPSGKAPLTVTYTYTEVNDGTDPISAVALQDDACSPVVATGGDDNANGLLDPGETWTYRCVRTFDRPGTYASHPTATGTDAVDNLAVALETAETSVTVASPPTEVLGISFTRAPRGPLPATGGEAGPALAAAGLLVLWAALGCSRRRLV